MESMCLAKRWNEWRFNRHDLSFRYPIKKTLTTTTTFGFWKCKVQRILRWYVQKWTFTTWGWIHFTLLHARLLLISNFIGIFIASNFYWWDIICCVRYTLGTRWVHQMHMHISSTWSDIAEMHATRYNIALKWFSRIKVTCLLSVWLMHRMWAKVWFTDSIFRQSYEWKVGDLIGYWNCDGVLGKVCGGRVFASWFLKW